MTKLHRDNDEIGRGAMIDTRKELQLRRESDWIDRQWKNSRTQRKTQKESEVIREREKDTDREYKKDRVTQKWARKKEREKQRD